ncbi:MAG: hypothetical protein JJU21_03070 [Salinarimonas sp.]|nr:hypothetical protein [Salinarimonas sp.]
MSIITRPIPTPNRAPPAEEFRRYLAEVVAQNAIIHATCAQDMAMIGDDEAMAYHLQCVIQAARLARDVLRDFRAAHGQEDRAHAA